MPESKIVRNEAPHKVRLSEGGDLASSRGPDLRGAADPVAGAVPLTSSAIVKARSERRVKGPDAAGKSVPSGVGLRPAVPDAPTVEPTPAVPVRAPVLPSVASKPPDKAPRPAVAKALPPVRAAAPPEPEIPWTTDSLVLQRVTSLRNRNARSQEQIQRLRRPYGSEGKTS